MISSSWLLPGGPALPANLARLSNSDLSLHWLSVPLIRPCKGVNPDPIIHPLFDCFILEPFSAHSGLAATAVNWAIAS